MCIILILYQLHPEAPLLIGANRDERHDRPSAPPGLLPTAPRRALGGRDLEHGGSWLGVNDAGLFVGLTNLGAGEASHRSRGEVVVEALGCATSEAVDARLGALMAAGRYRPFNLVYGTERRLRVARVDGGVLRMTTLGAGAHVVPSSGWVDDPALPRVSRALDGLRALATRGVTARQALRQMSALLTDHALPGARAGRSGRARRLQAVCVHTPGYGTRSSALIAVGADGALLRYLHSEGPACRAPFVACEGRLPSAVPPDLIQSDHPRPDHPRPDHPRPDHPPPGDKQR